MITLASYNIRKAVGLDRRRDPERIIAVLNEIGADIVTLQEADRRFGSRQTCLPLALIEEHSPYRPVALSRRTGGIGWHGNAMLARRTLEVLDAAVVPLPTLEPRGAIRADFAIDGQRLRVVGMHLDISGIRRRQQIRTILDHVAACPEPAATVLMGDFNEWSATGGALREFAPDYRVLAPGRSFHTRRPVAQLDRIVVSADIAVDGCGVHRSALAAKGSDHLPVWAQIEL
jgi:endonuclease/exonuclease/phosphatase family metal-dependent hydrolase